MDTVGQHVIVSKNSDANTAARRVCSWINRQRPKVILVTVSQVHFEGVLYTTIFWKQSSTNEDMGGNSEHKSRPGTGDKRLTKQPLKMDRLPKGIYDAIIYLRREGKTWLEIETISARPFSEDWPHNGGGFVDWNALPAEVRRLFPRRQLPHANLHRWYDLRVEQPANF